MNTDVKLTILIIGAAIIVAVLCFLFVRKTVTKLFIVGNGFDMYHGISSSYLRFRDYVKQNDEDVYDALEKYLYLHGDNEWNQFEKNMANLDADELLDEMKVYLGDYEKTSSYSDFQYETGKVTDSLGEKMQELFLKWILQLDVKHHSSSPKLSMPKDQLYLNFNYTSSLEKLYAIPEKNILYIHSKAVDKSSSIVLGHGWEHYSKATQEKDITLQDVLNGDPVTEGEEDWQYTEAKQYIESYFEKSYKNSSEIIQLNRPFFKRLRRIEEIYVMGHSMSEVDSRYFEAVAKNINVKKVKWTISYYRKEDIENYTKTLEKIGVDLSLVEFKKLEEFFTRQLRMFK